MKSNTMFAVVTVLLAVLATPFSLAAQQTRYRLVVIGTFGGPQSGLFFEDASALTNNGAVVGQADTAIPDPNFGNFNPWDKTRFFSTPSSGRKVH